MKSQRRSLVFLCDTNGRPLPQNSLERQMLKGVKDNIDGSKAKGKEAVYQSTPSKANLRKTFSECSSIEKLKYDDTNLLQNKLREVIPEAKNEDTPNKLPAWISDPFGVRKEEPEEEADVQDNSTPPVSGLKSSDEDQVFKDISNIKDRTARTKSQRSQKIVVIKKKGSKPPRQQNLNINKNYESETSNCYLKPQILNNSNKNRD